MKDKHNVILIRVSSKWLIPYSGGSSKFLISFIHLSFSQSSNLSRLYHREAPSKSLQGFTLCFQLLFLSIILLLPEFFMEALHGGSSRILFILQLFFMILLEVKIRQAILKNKHGAQHMFCFEELKHSSSCYPECNFFLPYLWRWYYVILDNLSSCFMIHMLLRMRYFKSINLVIGVTLGYISPKAFPKDCCYLWCL